MNDKVVRQRPDQSSGRRWVTGSAAGLALIFAALASPLWAQGYESPPVLSASVLLPAQILRGPHHRVDERVVNDGYLNHYTIHSQFGEFSVVSTATLRKRVDEIGALALMEQVEGTEEFGKAILEAGEDTLHGVKSLVTDPIGTVGGAASGIGKIFGRAKEGLFGSKRSDAEDGRLQSMLGFSDKKREYAAEFGVDAYSHNEVLQEQLDDMAWAGFAGSFSARLAMAAVPGGAGVALSVVNNAEMLNDVFRTTAPTDLRTMNRKKLLAMGVSEEVTALYLDNSIYTPREQTLLVAALEKMTGVRGREAFIRFAVLTSNTQIAFFRQRQAQMYAAFHRKVTPISEFVAVGQLAAARLADGTMVFVVPLDLLSWTEPMAGFVLNGDAYINQNFKPTAKQLWLAGGATDLAKGNIAALGWELKVNGEGVLVPQLPY